MKKFDILSVFSGLQNQKKTFWGIILFIINSLGSIKFLKNIFGEYNGKSFFKFKFSNFLSNINLAQNEVNKFTAQNCQNVQKKIKFDSPNHSVRINVIDLHYEFLQWGRD